MKLKVPIIKQKSKVGCGAAAMSMIYKYFGKDISEKEIEKEIGGFLKFGSFATDHALMAKKLGFMVVCHSYNLEYFEPSDVKLSRQNLIRRTKLLIKKEKKNLRKKELASILRVLKSEISFKMKMPSLNIIRKLLDKNLPVVLIVNSVVLFERKFGGKKDLDMGHYIMLTGYQKEKFYYNDPYSSKSYSVSNDKLIFALSNNALYCSAYLLVINR